MPGTTSRLDLPTKIQSLPGEYTDQQLRRFFKTCPPWERALFQTFLLTGFREQEVMYLHWDDIKWKQSMIQVRAKPSLGFYPKRWEERAIPVKRSLLATLKKHPKHPGSPFVFPSPRGNRELHMLDKCKAVASKACLKPADFNLRIFRSTYATRMLRAGFDVRTVQAWMGHKSLETTMRYLSPAQDVHDQLNQLKGIFQEI